MRALNLVSIAETPAAAADGTRRRTRVWALALTVLMVAAMGIWALWWRTTRPETRSLVVLPCKAIEGDTQGQAFCDGLADTINAKLTPLALSRGLQTTSTYEVRRRAPASDFKWSTASAETAREAAAPIASRHSGCRLWNCACETPSSRGIMGLLLSCARTISFVIW
jgi:hypothetical protein